jgi:hypothetical protein
VESGRPICLGLPRYLPSDVRDKMISDIREKGFAVIDNLMGAARATALLNELNSIFDYPLPLMKRSTSSIFVNGQMVEYEKQNVFSISDFSIIDPVLYNESDRALLDPENSPQNISRLASSPIPLTLDFERWLRTMLLDVFNGYRIEPPPPPAVNESGGTPAGTTKDADKTTLQLINAHPKVPVSASPFLSLSRSSTIL